MAGWSELPDDLLRLIAKRLKSTTGFSGVCRSWRSVAPKKLSHLRHLRPPWLMRRSQRHSHFPCGLFQLDGTMVRQVEIYENGKERYIGSSGIWLIVVTQNREIHLMTPFFRINASLPSKVVFDHGEEEEGLAFEEFPEDFNKVILSSSPLNCSNVTAVAIYDSRMLGFARPGDQAWKRIECSRQEAFHDIIFYKEQVHAVNSLGTVFACDINGGDHPPKAIKVVDHFREGPDSWIDQSSGYEYHRHFKYYLVEVLGDLMLVLKSVTYKDTTKYQYQYGPFETEKFEVFKLDFTSMKWDLVKSLGSRSLFLGNNSSVSLKALDSSSSFRKNCIYFTHGGYVRVFSMEDESIESIYTDDHGHFPSPIWVIS